jgi:hypothetical protein
MVLDVIDIPGDGQHAHAHPASQITGCDPTSAKILKRPRTSRIAGLEKVGQHGAAHVTTVFCFGEPRYASEADHGAGQCKQFCQNLRVHVDPPSPSYLELGRVIGGRGEANESAIKSSEIF